ncbi:MAG: hypothetical protein ABI548_10020 [Polyangiaceae bacterium]
MRCTSWILSALSLLALGSCSNSGHGEVLLVVSTDLSLPADLDWLDWSVTRISDSTKITQGSLPLDAFNTLPATLAIVSGAEGAESVLVKLDGRSGGSGGALRVHREAQLTIPDAGVKMLRMPLNWLCSDANLKTACADGLTCQAGSCVNSRVTTALPDYVPIDKSKCFDVRACTLEAWPWREAPPTIDPTNGDCIMAADALFGPKLSVNVALVINTPLVGNAGVCAANGDTSTGAKGDCFVPLNQDDTPDGWRFEQNAQGQTVVRLPPAVCDASASGPVKKVAVSPSRTSDCPVKSESNPLCDAPAVCVASPDICPPTFPSDGWAGYSCSGSAQPTDADLHLPSVAFCWLADTDPAVGPVVTKHFCCETGQVPAPVKDPLLIDDMSGGSTIKLAAPAGDNPGGWYTASDDTAASLSPPRAGSLFTYQSIEPAFTATNGPPISSAACFSMSHGFTGYFALEGFNWVQFPICREKTKRNRSVSARGLKVGAQFRQISGYQT